MCLKIMKSSNSWKAYEKFQQYVDLWKGIRVSSSRFLPRNFDPEKETSPWEMESPCKKRNLAPEKGNIDLEIENLTPGKQNPRLEEKHSRPQDFLSK